MNDVTGCAGGFGGVEVGVEGAAGLLQKIQLKVSFRAKGIFFQFA